MPLRSILICLLLTGCTDVRGGQPLQGEDLNVMLTTVSLWTSAGLPYTDDCASQQPRIHLVITDTPCGFSNLRGCMEYADGVIGGVDFGKKTPLLWIRTDSSAEPYRSSLIRHETLHWLAECSTRDPDRLHSRPEVWALDTPGE